MLRGKIGPILNQGKMLRWLNNQTQNDHISSFSMLLWWFVHSGPNNVDGMKDKWLHITECLYESSLGRNYRLRINALLLLQWWSLCICLFFLLTGQTQFISRFGVAASKRLQLRNGTSVDTHTLLEGFLLWTDTVAGLCSTKRGWCFSDKCI